MKNTNKERVLFLILAVMFYTMIFFVPTAAAIITMLLCGVCIGIVIGDETAE